MNSEFTYGAALLSLRIIFNLITAATLIVYKSPVRNNYFATIMAMTLAGSSLAMAVSSYTRFSQLAPLTEFPPVLFLGAICLLFLVNGGNVAHAYSRTQNLYYRIVPWSKR